MKKNVEHLQFMVLKKWLDCNVRWDKKRRTKFKYETVFEMNKNQIRS